jgi:uncharacterized protein (DUF1501 family)
MHTSRRTFLTVASSTTLVALSPAVPAFLRRAAALENGSGNSPAGERVLVVLQLTGGNDGLNTVIPYADDDYAKNRFSLRHDVNSVLKIDDYVGLHPSLRGFAELLEQDRLAIVQGVGYRNPNRSHFESMDIWHTAVPKLPAQRSGWLGRGLDAARRDGGDLPAIHLGSEVQPLALATRDVAVPSLASLDGFKLNTGGDRDLARAIRENAGIARPASDELLGFLQVNTTAALAASERVERAMKDYRSGTDYPGTALAQKLRGVAQLINAGLNTRIYYLALDGFDSHSNQRDAHAGLLSELSGAVAAFLSDVSEHGHSERVLVMTFSEFGRRVKENASQGTDHGAAAPMFLAGAQVQPGLIGEHPSLTDLDDGDLKFHTDFRGVYAAVLRDWLGWAPGPIVGDDITPIDVIRT